MLENLTQVSLHQFLHNPQQELSEPLLWQLAIDIAEGLAYLRNKNILHRDLKSSNILLNSNYRVKLSDLGIMKTKSYIWQPISHVQNCKLGSMVITSLFRITSY